jgi:hypothetical protein
MRGRPKKYKTHQRILVFVDKDVLKKFDSIYSNRSDKINKLMLEALSSSTEK